MRNSTARLRRVRRHNAFTLIELLLVMVIIAILASIVVPRLVGKSDKAYKTAAVAQLSGLKSALSAFEIANGRYPTSEEGLQALVTNPGNLNNWSQEMDTIPLDPWGEAYIYRCPGNGRDYDLLCKGKDKQEGTADDIDSQ